MLIVAGATSENKTVISDIPQNLVFGPLLFSFCFSDLQASTPGLWLSKFAGDCKLSVI